MGPKLENASKKELTYSYSSSEDGTEDESLNGSFGGPSVAKWVFFFTFAKLEQYSEWKPFLS